MTHTTLHWSFPGQSIEMHCQLCWTVTCMIFLDWDKVSPMPWCVRVGVKPLILLVGASPSDKYRVSAHARLSARCLRTITLVRRNRPDYNVPCSGRYKVDVSISIKVHSPFPASRNKCYKKEPFPAILTYTFRRSLSHGVSDSPGFTVPTRPGNVTVVRPLTVRIVGDLISVQCRCQHHFVSCDNQ